MSPLIRLADDGDADQIAAIYAPNVLHTVISFEDVPPTEAAMAQRIRSTTATHPWLVCVDGGAVLGYAYAGQHRARTAYQWATEVSAYVADHVQRRGVGRALYTALFAVLRAQGFYHAYAGVTLPNAASVGLHTALGFEPVGVYRNVGYKFGAWHDVGWWQLALQPLADPVAPPQSLAAVRDTDAWNAALAAGVALVRDPRKERA